MTNGNFFWKALRQELKMHKIHKMHKMPMLVALAMHLLPLKTMLR